MQVDSFMTKPFHAQHEPLNFVLGWQIVSRIVILSIYEVFKNYKSFFIIFRNVVFWEFSFENSFSEGGVNMITDDFEERNQIEEANWKKWLVGEQLSL